MPEFSLIVPVYNVEKYLADCLDSCLNQTFHDIEIICINDCSPDESYKILNVYAKKDSRRKPSAVAMGNCAQEVAYRREGSGTG